MLTQERHLQILAQLEEKGTVSVAQLTQLLGASESTVRRDLIALDRLGKLHKVHGGATLTRRDFIRREEKLDEKQSQIEKERRRYEKEIEELKRQLAERQTA